MTQTTQASTTVRLIDSDASLNINIKDNDDFEALEKRVAKLEKIVKKLLSGDTSGIESVAGII